MAEKQYLSSKISFKARVEQSFDIRLFKACFVSSFFRDESVDLRGRGCSAPKQIIIIITWRKSEAFSEKKIMSRKDQLFEWVIGQLEPVDLYL